MTDIKLSDTWTLTRAANGDAPMISGIECYVQDIKLEALTQEGELFYDEQYGWSLLDFIQREDDALTLIEIKNRVKEKLSRREAIASESIRCDVMFREDTIFVTASFQLVNNSQVLEITVSLDRVKVVMTDD